MQTDILDLSLQCHENLQLQMAIPEHQPDHKVIVALGIEFYQDIRGTYKSVDKKHNAMAVLRVF